MSPLLVLLLLQARWLLPPSGVVALDGPWRFRAGDAAAYASPALVDSAWPMVIVPDAWNNHGGARPRGFAWYRGRIVFDRAPGRELGLQVRASGMAVEVYVDGEALGRVGGFPPDYGPRTNIPATFTLPLASLAPGTHVVAVRVYSVESGPVSFGPVFAEPLNDMVAAQHRGDLYMLGAALLFVGLAIYQFVFWARRREALEHLYIFLFCAGLALYFVNWMPSVRLALAPLIDWFRLYVALSAAAITALALGARNIFEIEPEGLLARAIAALAVFFGFIVPLALLLPDWSMVRWLERFLYNGGVLVAGAVLIALAVSARRRGLEHGTVLFWGSAALVLTVVHDVGLSWGMLPRWGGGAITVQYGALAFVLSVAFTTAAKFADSQTTALYDRLTGLYRREVVMDALAREIRRAARVRQSVAVIMADIDRFKAVNDSIGHQGGDRVLAEVGRRLADAGRAVDWLGRYGGDEFIAVLAATGTTGGLQAAERFRAAVAALPIETGRTAHTLTLSAGVASYDGGEEWPTAEQLVGAADSALYRAKEAGRNRASE
ncbi:MAG: diguanylate cyclase [Gemmatimonadales bacterium]|jgi:diguanylate cyclase (GGDEF)-like protein